MGRLRRLRAAAVLAGMVATALAVRALAQDRDRPIPPGLLADERNTIEVFRRVSRSVAYVRNNQIRRDFFTLNVLEVPRGSGTGFVWDRHGHVVTNLHVIRGGNSFSVTLADGTTYRARVAGVDPRKDLAVLRIEAPAERLVPIEVGDSSMLVVGQKVLAIGNPFGLDQTLTTGVISALGREIPAAGDVVIEDVIQTDAEINPGNSGGPLLDSAGRLIGVNTAIFSPTGASAGIGFAVPVDAFRRVVPQIVRWGRVRHAGLGVTILPDSLAERWGVRGVIVRGVQRGGPAARAGLEPLAVGPRGEVRRYDVIVAIDDRPVGTSADLTRILDRLDPGDEVVVHWERDGKARHARVPLAEVQ